MANGPATTTRSHSSLSGGYKWLPWQPRSGSRKNIPPLRRQRRMCWRNRRDILRLRRNGMANVRRKALRMHASDTMINSAVGRSWKWQHRWTKLTFNRCSNALKAFVSEPSTVGGRKFGDKVRRVISQSVPSIAMSDAPLQSVLLQSDSLPPPPPLPRP